MNPYLHRAYVLYDQRRYEMAEKEVGQALLSQPNDARSLALLALCLVEQEKFSEATTRAQEAVGNAPDESFSHYTLARVWLARNYLDKAEQEIQAALAIDPHVTRYHVAQALIHYRRSNWPLALAAAEVALSLDPDDADAVNLRAEALRKLGRKDIARDHLREQLARDPDDPRTHASLGWNYLEKGDRDKAMEHFREALRLDPELDWAREGVVETLKSKSRFYRGVLRYFFWISRFSPRAQLGIVIGLFIAYRIALQMLSDWQFWTLLIGYGLFVLTTWFAVPLSNLFLTLHPFGRLALSREERWTALGVGALLPVFLLGAVLSITASSLIALSIGSAALAAACTLATPSPWPRSAMVVYLKWILVVAACSVTLLSLPKSVYDASIVIRIGAGLTTLVMILNLTLCTLLPGLLMQRQPRRN